MRRLKLKKTKSILFFILFVFINFYTPSYTLGAYKATIPSSQTLLYVIGPEDIMEISVWKNAELSKEVVVRPDGMISLPLIGDVQAAGLTPDQLRLEIVEKLKEYQDTVVVSVIIKEVLSYNIFILGEVVKPGIYTLKRKTTLLQAFAIAGGFNQFASKNKIIIIREKTDGSTGEMKIKIRFDDIIKKADSTMNLILQPGDTIFVP